MGSELIHSPMRPEDWPRYSSSAGSCADNALTRLAANVDFPEPSQPVIAITRTGERSDEGLIC